MICDKCTEEKHGSSYCEDCVNEYRNYIERLQHVVELKDLEINKLINENSKLNLMIAQVKIGNQI